MANILDFIYTSEYTFIFIYHLNILMNIKNNNYLGSIDITNIYPSKSFSCGLKHWFSIFY